MIAVIVPFSRPTMAENVIANIKRQRLPEPAILIVVENGSGVGGFDKYRLHGAVVQSEQGCTHARTAGLQKARELGCEWFTLWDDDDWYGPGFVEFMWAHRERADLIGLCHHVIRDAIGDRWFVRMREPGPVERRPGDMMVSGIASAALFGRTERALDWTKHPPFSAECDWYTDMYDAGRTLLGLADPNPSEPLMYLRRFRDPRHGHALPNPCFADHPGVASLVEPVATSGLKLHLGAGPHYLEGWRNHDRDVDLRKPLPWVDGAAEFIFCEHTIEHLTTPEGVRLIEECFRVLAPGGVLRLSFPDVARIWALGASDITRRVDAQRERGVDVSTREDCIRQALTGCGHLSAWTEQIALIVLQSAGFDPYAVRYGVSPVAALAGIDGHHLATGSTVELETSAVEGFKPAS